MNILILTYQGDLAGSTFSISYLAEALANRGHKVYVGLRRESLLYDLLNNSGVERIPMTFSSRFDRNNISTIRDVVKKHKIQIINAQSSLDRYTSIFATKWYHLPVKVVHTRRQNPKSVGGLQNLFYKWGTDKIVVISNELKKAFLKMGFKDRNLRVIHNGVPTDRYEEWSEERAAQLRMELEIKPEDTVIGCVSRLKNQDQILAALQRVDIDNLVMIFCGIEEEMVRDKIPIGSPVRLIFLGNIDKGEILDYYRIFDLNILASTMDGFGLVLVEAMAMECPVLATDFGGIKDVIQNGENGLLFEDGNIEELASKIKELIRDEKLRHKLIENGKDTAYNEFTMEKTAILHEQLFAELLDIKLGDSR